MGAVTEQEGRGKLRTAAPGTGAVAARQRGQYVVVALAGILLAPAFLFLLLRLLTPFDNGRLQPGSDAVLAEGVIVTPLPNGPPGFAAGDLVLAMGGQRLDALTAAALRAPHAWRPRFWFDGATSESLTYTVQREGWPVDITITTGGYPLGDVLRSNWGTFLYALSFLVIAAYVFWRRPDQQAPRLLLLIAAALVCATTWSLGVDVSDFISGAGLYLFFLTILPGFMLVWILTFHFALIFPEPLPLTRRVGRWLLLIYFVPYLLLVLYLILTWRGASNTLDWIASWGLPADVTAAVFLLPALLITGWQYRRSSGETRAQMRWLALAALLVGGGALLFYFLPPLFGGEALNSNLIGLLGVLFPAAVAVAILRHNLFDIDTLLNRALVYGILTAMVLLIYVLIVGGAGALLQTQANWVTAAVATGLVAVLFQPLRERVQRGVNRLMYGQRDEPFEVLAALGQRLEGTLTPEMVYPTLVETVAETLKLPYAAIAVHRQDGYEIAVSYGKPPADPLVYPLVHQGETVGQLLVAPRERDEPLSLADERLLRNIARQAGAAVQMVQLTSDLQRSRRELVTAREEERRRLRRDLHDGVGPSLASLYMQSGVLRRLMQTNPQAAEQLLDELRGDIRITIDEVRRVAHNLRPPALDQLGLVAALRAHSASSGQAHSARGAAGETPEEDEAALRITVTAPDALPALPAAVEVAAYRIVQEAITNVRRHAGATRCNVALALARPPFTPALEVEVIDNGRGLDEAYAAGVGLLSMRERAAELGGRCTVQALPEGGTRVWASLPLPEEKNE